MDPQTPPRWGRRSGTLRVQRCADGDEEVDAAGWSSLSVSSLASLLRQLACTDSRRAVSALEGLQLVSVKGDWKDKALEDLAESLSSEGRLARAAKSSSPSM